MQAIPVQVMNALVEPMFRNRVMNTQVADPRFIFRGVTRACRTIQRTSERLLPPNATPWMRAQMWYQVLDDTFELTRRVVHFLEGWYRLHGQLQAFRAHSLFIRWVFHRTTLQERMSLVQGGRRLRGWIMDYLEDNNDQVASYTRRVNDHNLFHRTHMTPSA